MCDDVDNELDQLLNTCDPGLDEWPASSPVAAAPDMSTQNCCEESGKASKAQSHQGGSEEPLMSSLSHCDIGETVSECVVGHDPEDIPHVSTNGSATEDRVAGKYDKNLTAQETCESQLKVAAEQKKKFTPKFGQSHRKIKVSGQTKPAWPKSTRPKKIQDPAVAEKTDRRMTVQTESFSDDHAVSRKPNEKKVEANSSVKTDETALHDAGKLTETTTEEVGMDVAKLANDQEEEDKGLMTTGKQVKSLHDPGKNVGGKERENNRKELTVQEKLQKKKQREEKKKLASTVKEERQRKKQEAALRKEEKQRKREEASLARAKQQLLKEELAVARLQRQQQKQAALLAREERKKRKEEEKKKKWSMKLSPNVVGDNAVNGEPVCESKRKQCASRSAFSAYVTGGQTGEESASLSPSVNNGERSKEGTNGIEKNGDMWVECCLCGKWRCLGSGVSQSTLKENWNCLMNADLEHNSCDAEEECWQNMDDSYTFVPSDLGPGTVVWARVDGYPWWPGVIDIDPEYETFVEIDEEEEDEVSRYSNPTMFHVVFGFDAFPTRAWIHSNSIKLLSKTDKLSDFGQDRIAVYGHVASMGARHRKRHNASLDSSLDNNDSDGEKYIPRKAKRSCFRKLPANPIISSELEGENEVTDDLSGEHNNCTSTASLPASPLL